jgi:hypothetical protein
LNNSTQVSIDHNVVIVDQNQLIIQDKEADDSDLKKETFVEQKEETKVEEKNDVSS